MFFERALLAETISDPKRKKTILFFLWFWSLLSTTSMVYEGSRVKTFGPLSFKQVYPCGVQYQKFHPHTCFLNVHPWQKPFQTPRAKKLSYSFFDSGLCCPPPVWFMKTQEWKLLGHFFLDRYTLAGSNIKNSIHIRVFWTRTPGRNHFRPQGQKNYLILSLILVFVVHHRSGLWRLKSENFLGHLFFYRYTLARSNIKNSIHIRVFWTCTPGRNHFRPQGQKTYLIFSLILVFVVLSTISTVSWRAENRFFRVNLLSMCTFEGLYSPQYVHAKWSFFNLHPWQKPFQEADKNPESQITNPKSKKQKSKIPNPQIKNVVYVYIYFIILIYIVLCLSAKV